jgi:hypothetical protein
MCCQQCCRFGALLSAPFAALCCRSVAAAQQDIAGHCRSGSRPSDIPEKQTGGHRLITRQHILQVHVVRLPVLSQAKPGMHGLPVHVMHDNTNMHSRGSQLGLQHAVVASPRLMILHETALNPTHEASQC